MQQTKYTMIRLSFAVFFNGSLSFMHFEFKTPTINVKFALRLRHGEFSRGCFEYRRCGYTDGFIQDHNRFFIIRGIFIGYIIDYF